MAKRTKLVKRGKRVTACKLPKATRSSQKRAAKAMEPYVDDLQRAADEESRNNLGIAAGSSAKGFRKRVSEMLEEE